MGTWTLIQIVFDIFMACGLFVVVMRMNRAPKDDPRLSRGLQLLQSKISVLEDLSDRTEAQVNQLTAILESKAREVQAKVQLADQHVQEIRVSMDRSLEVAKIFQDKIPHKEIIERQNTIKYVQAARLAHQGSSVDEIAKVVDLPRGEVEFIASVNRERLMFDESQLPEWVATSVTSEPGGDLTREQAAAAGVNFDRASNVAASSETAESQEEQTARLRAEIELAENQRLVENLSRLQNEMQSLDQKLTRESAGRNFAAAFEVPKVETESLKKLGEEFRKAVREGEAADARQPFPPLESLSSLIPNFIEAGEVDAPVVMKANAPHIVQPTAPNTLSDALKQSVVSPARVADLAGESLAASAAEPAVSGESKIQAALRATAKPANTSKTLSAEVEAARALAREVSPNKSLKPEVKKVIFPRIDGSDV